MRAGCGRPQRGFTLIELLVALFITAIIFAMGYGAINQALKNRESLEERQSRLTAVQNAMRVMVQDFGQLTPRPVRDVLDHVKAVHFRYLTDARQWTDQWPPLTTITSSPLAGNQQLRIRPLAVEITLDLDDWGTLVRIVEVPT